MNFADLLWSAGKGQSPFALAIFDHCSSSFRRKGVVFSANNTLLDPVVAAGCCGGNKGSSTRTQEQWDQVCRCRQSFRSVYVYVQHLVQRRIYMILGQQTFRLFPTSPAYLHCLSNIYRMPRPATVTLNDGIRVPLLGYGTATALYRKDAKDWVKMAYVEASVRHIDTAADYGNEDTVGAAIKELGIDREEIFITTKRKLSSLCFRLLTRGRSAS